MRSLLHTLKMIVLLSLICGIFNHESYYCTTEDKKRQYCTKEYRPVCAFPTTACHNTTNCGRTFPTRCVACRDPDVGFVISGVCQEAPYLSLNFLGADN
jgi:hypothetical protein